MLYCTTTHNFIVTDQFKKECYNGQYNLTYWRTAQKVGFLKAELIDKLKLSDNEICDALKDITIYECLGIYSYFIKNKNPTWSKILLLNPFNENIILNAFLTIYWKKDILLSDDINNYPNQKQLMIDHLSDDAETFCNLYEDNVRLHILAQLQSST